MEDEDLSGDAVRDSPRHSLSSNVLCSTPAIIRRQSSSWLRGASPFYSKNGPSLSPFLDKAALLEEIRKLREDNTQSHRELQRMKDENMEFDRVVQQGDEMILELKEELIRRDEVIQELHEENDRLREYCLDTRKLDEELEKAKENLRRAGDNEAELIRQVEAGKLQLLSLKKEKQEIEKKEDETRKERELLKVSQAAMKQVITIRDAELADAKSSLVYAERDVKVLARAVEEERQHKSDIMTRLVEAEKQRQSEMREHQAQIDGLQKELIAARSCEAKAKQETEGLSNAMDMLQEITVTLEETHKKLKMAEDENSRLLSRSQQLSKRTEDLLSEKEVMLEKERSLRNNLDRCSDEKNKALLELFEVQQKMEKDQRVFEITLQKLSLSLTDAEQRATGSAVTLNAMQGTLSAISAQAEYRLDQLRQALFIITKLNSVLESQDAEIRAVAMLRKEKEVISDQKNRTDRVAEERLQLIEDLTKSVEQARLRERSSTQELERLAGEIADVRKDNDSLKEGIVRMVASRNPKERIDWVRRFKADADAAIKERNDLHMKVLKLEKELEQYRGSEDPLKRDIQKRYESPAPVAVKERKKDREDEEKKRLESPGRTRDHKREKTDDERRRDQSLTAVPEGRKEDEERRPEAEKRFESPAVVRKDRLKEHDEKKRSAEKRFESPGLPNERRKERDDEKRKEIDRRAESPAVRARAGTHEKDNKRLSGISEKCRPGQQSSTAATHETVGSRGEPPMSPTARTKTASVARSARSDDTTRKATGVISGSLPKSTGGKQAPDESAERSTGDVSHGAGMSSLKSSRGKTSQLETVRESNSENDSCPQSTTDRRPNVHDVVATEESKAAINPCAAQPSKASQKVRFADLESADSFSRSVPESPAVSPLDIDTPSASMVRPKPIMAKVTILEKNEHERLMESLVSPRDLRPSPSHAHTSPTVNALASPAKTRSVATPPQARSFSRAPKVEETRKTSKTAPSDKDKENKGKPAPTKARSLVQSLSLKSFFSGEKKDKGTREAQSPRTDPEAAGEQKGVATDTSQNRKNALDALVDQYGDDCRESAQFLDEIATNAAEDSETRPELRRDSHGEYTDPSSVALVADKSGRLDILGYVTIPRKLGTTIKSQLKEMGSTKRAEVEAKKKQVFFPTKSK